MRWPFITSSIPIWRWYHEIMRAMAAAMTMMTSESDESFRGHKTTLHLEWRYRLNFRTYDRMSLLHQSPHSRSRMSILGRYPCLFLLGVVFCCVQFKSDPSWAPDLVVLAQWLGNRRISNHESEPQSDPNPVEFHILQISTLLPKKYYHMYGGGFTTSLLNSNEMVLNTDCQILERNQMVKFWEMTTF